MIEEVQMRAGRIMVEGRHVCSDGENHCKFLTHYRLGMKIVPSCILDGVWSQGLPPVLKLENDLLVPSDKCILKSKGEVIQFKRKREKDAEFVPPTQEEVNAYASEINFTGAIQFFQYYSANGWKAKIKGKLCPMKNWKQAMLGWRKRDEERAAWKHSKLPPERKGYLVV